MIEGLIGHFAQQPSFGSVQRHYKLEEWAAAETFAYFDQLNDDWHLAGTLPYFTKGTKNDGWMDAYARQVANGKTKLHVWIEFKALTIGAAKRSAAIKSHADDIRKLAGIQWAETEEMWRNQYNSKRGNSERAWFERQELPGLLSEGEHVGFAVLFVALNEKRTAKKVEDKLMPVALESGAKLIVQLDSMDGKGGIGCFAWQVPMK